MESRRFAAVVTAVSPGKLLVPVPFDPDQVWGAKQRHHIAGTVNGIRVRAVNAPTSPKTSRRPWRPTPTPGSSSTR